MSANTRPVFYIGEDPKNIVNFSSTSKTNLTKYSNKYSNFSTYNNVLTQKNEILQTNIQEVKTQFVQNIQIANRTCNTDSYYSNTPTNRANKIERELTCHEFLIKLLVENIW
jgi:hypothetical protein